MPGSIRALDATALRHDPVDDFSSSPPQKMKMKVNREKSDLVAQIQLPPSPADSDTPLQDSSEASSANVECRYMRDIDRGAPGDAAIFSSLKTPEQKELAKRKSQYYGDVFACREPNGSARERVSKNSLIMADVRTNVIVQDEYQFITDLSYQLSTRYQRSENSIIVTVAHSTCLLFAGNFDPAYTLTITALPSQLQPVTNKRNAALLAKAMEDVLGVGPERGLIKFQAIAEENMATCGKTVAGEIDDLEKEAAEANSSLQRSLSRKSQSKSRRRSIKSLRGTSKTSPLPTQYESTTSTSNEGWESPTMPAVPTEKSPLDRKAEKVRKMGRRKSFMASIFGKS